MLQPLPMELGVLWNPLVRVSIKGCVYIDSFPNVYMSLIRLSFNEVYNAGKVYVIGVLINGRCCTV